MVLQVLYNAATTILPFKYWPYAGVAAAVLVVIYAYAQGRSTNRERDLHARVILLTVSMHFSVQCVGRRKGWRDLAGQEKVLLRSDVSFQCD